MLWSSATLFLISRLKPKLTSRKSRARASITYVEDHLIGMSRSRPSVTSRIEGSSDKSEFFCRILWICANISLCLLEDRSWHHAFNIPYGKRAAGKYTDLDRDCTDDSHEIVTIVWVGNMCLRVVRIIVPGLALSAKQGLRRKVDNMCQASGSKKAISTQLIYNDLHQKKREKAWAIASTDGACECTCGGLNRAAMGGSDGCREHLENHPLVLSSN